MTPRIKAEMADYSFEVYACHETDSALIVRRNEVVAGDFYVISGQSNAAATVFGAWSSKYARTVARTPDGKPDITPGDTLWTRCGVVVDVCGRMGAGKCKRKFWSATAFLPV
jgi:hypothetical protein